MAKKTVRTQIVEIVDKALIETGAELSANDAIELVMVKAGVKTDKATVVALYNQRLAKYMGTKPADFLREYVEYKFTAYANGDKGARGDAIEALVRYHIKRKFITYGDVKVQEIGKVDITSKALKLEIGHNGKTFQSAFVPADRDKASFTEQNYMAGDYECVIYGAFRAESFSAEFVLNDEKFLRTMKVFTDKFEFPRAIAGRNGLASGWNVAHERATVQYNESLRLRFKDYCAEHGVMTLGEWLESR